MSFLQKGTMPGVDEASVGNGKVTDNGDISVSVKIDENY
jgi:hypothetical protein